MAWYPLNGNLKDYTGNENNLINNGAIVNSSGKIGKCYYNNGTNSNLKIPIKTSKTMTFMLWIKIPFDPTTISGFKHIIDCRDGAGYETLVIMPTYLKFFNSSKNLEFSEYNDFKDKWHHIATTINANTKETKLFIDGELKVVATSNESSENASGYAVIGSRYSDTNYVEEYVNDVRIYNHCLSDAEIKEVSKGLVLHYTMDSMYGNSNLLLGSHRFYNAGGGSAGITSSITENGELKVIAENGNWKSFSMSNIDGTKESIQNNMNVGDKFVVSFDIKIENGSGIPTLFLNEGNGYETMIGNPNLIGKWQRVYKVRTWNDPRNRIWIFVFAFRFFWVRRHLLF